MNFLVDAQLPPALAQWLRELGHTAQPVRELGLREAEDDAIWNHALQSKAVIITKDEDFVLLAQQNANGPPSFGSASGIPPIAPCGLGSFRKYRK